MKNSAHGAGLPDSPSAPQDDLNPHQDAIRRIRALAENLNRANPSFYDYPNSFIEEVVATLLSALDRTEKERDGSSNASPSPLDAARHSSDETPAPSAPFQARVEPWMRETFGDVIPFDREERGDRFLEEVFELLQSGGYDPSRIATLQDYVWGRPPGDPPQEVGGVMVTLAAYCLAFGLDMHEAGETELARVWTKVEAIRAKQAAKPRGIALPIDPTGGA